MAFIAWYYFSLSMTTALKKKSFTSKTTAPGGASTIGGIWYQMLWSLFIAAEIVVKTPPSTHAAQLVLEPPSGGDLLVATSSTLTVQQIKMRSGNKPWSLNDFVKEVLPDLYKAVELDSQQQQTFEFVTDSHQGQWKEVEEFFRKLKDAKQPPPGVDVLQSLSENKTIQFRGSLSAGRSGKTTLTERALFKQITSVVRKNSSTDDDMEQIDYRKLWKLLANLKFSWAQTEDLLQRQIIRHLRTVLDNPDEAESTLLRLHAALQKQAKNGNASVNSEDFFHKNGLGNIPLTSLHWPRVLVQAQERLNTEFSRLGYKPDEDVRPKLSQPERAAVEEWQQRQRDFLILSGESGQGKTWRLCSLARLLASEVPVVLISADGEESGAQLSETAARRFWIDFCGHSACLLGLKEIGGRVSEAAPAYAKPWLYLLVDNVSSFKQARQLREALYDAVGVRVIFTTSTVVADDFVAAPPAEAHIVSIKNFTEDELRRYLVGDDWGAWHDIPIPDQETLRFPILASLYRELAPDGRWTGKTEYDLYSTFYDRRLRRPLRRVDRVGELALKRASLSVWEEHAYPWSLEQLNDFGFESELLETLLNGGWLREDGRDRYAVRHDRLLNWQIAEALADGLIQGTLQADAVGERCAALLWDLPNNQPHRLGFVPMDLVWLLAQRDYEKAAADALDVLLDKIEKDYPSTRSLYEYLLPTVGASIASPIYRRLERIVEAPYDAVHREKLLSNLEAKDVAPGAIRLLQSENAELRRTGARILARCPAKEALAPLWERYCIFHIEEAQSKDLQKSVPWESMSLWSALKACVPLDSSWLESQINKFEQACSVSPEVPEVRAYEAEALTAFLSALPDNTLWLRMKNTLRPLLPKSAERHFAHNVYHWRDADEIDWVRGRITTTDNHQDAYCFQALIRIDPDLALNELPRLSPQAFCLTRKWTLRPLLALRPDKTASRILKLMHNGSHPWTYAAAFQARPDGMSEPVLNYLFEDLGPSLATGTVEDHWRAFQSLEDVYSLPLLSCFRQRAGTEWEEYLTAMIEREPLPTFWHNPMLEAAVTVLRKVNGTGYTRVINKWLASPKRFARMQGIDHAHHRPDTETIRLLEEIALMPAHEERESDSDEDQSWLPQMAQKALALIGAWPSVIKSLVHWQGRSNQEVLDALIGSHPLSDEDMKPALDALRDDSKHPGALMALGVGQRTDFLPQIVEILKAEDVHQYSAATNGCLWALAALPPPLPPEIVETLIWQLANLEGHWLVLHLLMREGDETSALALLDYLRAEFNRPREGGQATSDLYDLVRIAIHMIRRASTKQEAMRLCLDRMDQGSKLDYLGEQLVRDLGAESKQEPAFRFVFDSPRARQFLEAEAFQRDGGICYVGEKAKSLSSLASLDRENAYNAALRVLSRSQAHDREYTPYLLLELDHDRAPQDLLTFLTKSRKSEPGLAYTCARALADAKMDKALLSYLHSAEPAPLRAAACFVLGFCEPTSAIASAIENCFQDDDILVYEAGWESWHRLDDTRRVGELVEACHAEQNSAWRWLLLDAALETGDPGEPRRLAPPWIQRLCEKLPPLFVEYVVERLDKLQKKQKDALKPEED